MAAMARGLVLGQVAAVQVSGGENLGDAGNDSRDHADADKNPGVFREALLQQIERSHGSTSRTSR